MRHLIGWGWMILALSGCASSVVTTSDNAPRKYHNLIEKHQALAKQFESSGDLASAQTQWHIVKLLNPNDDLANKASDHVDQVIAQHIAQSKKIAQKASDDGNLKDATHAWLSILELDPSNTEAVEQLTLLGQKDHGSEQTKTLLGKFDKSKHTRNKRDANSVLASMAAEQHASLADNTSHVDESPRHQSATKQYEQAQHLESSGQDEQAFDAYRQAITQYGDQPPKEWSEHLQRLGKSLANRYYSKGVNAYQHDLPAAIDAWHTCLRYDPQHVQAALHLRDAEVYREKLKTMPSM